jgi:hypothetical protein
MAVRSMGFAELARATGAGLRTVKRWGVEGVPPQRLPVVVAALGVTEEPEPPSVAAAALDQRVGALVEEHGGREVLGSLVRVWRP